MCSEKLRGLAVRAEDLTLARTKSHPPRELSKNLMATIAIAATAIAATINRRFFHAKTEYMIATAATAIKPERDPENHKPTRARESRHAILLVDCLRVS